LLQNKKKPEYTGKMLVCLNKARPFSQLEDGEEIIQWLSNVRIKKSGIKNKKNFIALDFSKEELAVPVCILNADCIADNNTIFNMKDDWTNVSSPIIERQCQPLPKWFPKCIFDEGMIGNIAEEILFDLKSYTIKLKVKYIFQKESIEELFGNIPDIENNDISSAGEYENEYLPKEDGEMEKEKEKSGNDDDIGQYKYKGLIKLNYINDGEKKKFVIPILPAALGFVLGMVIYHSVKWFFRNKN
jgi:hypothetical protein